MTYLPFPFPLIILEIFSLHLLTFASFTKSSFFVLKKSIR